MGNVQARDETGGKDHAHGHWPKAIETGLLSTGVLSGSHAILKSQRI